MTYIIPNSNATEHSGKSIISATKGNFLGIIVDGKKKLIKKNNIKINEYSTYRINIEKDMVRISEGTGWCCSKDEYDAIMRDGNRVLNELFGDLM